MVGLELDVLLPLMPQGVEHRITLKFSIFQ